MARSADQRARQPSSDLHEAEGIPKGTQRCSQYDQPREGHGVGSVAPFYGTSGLVLTERKGYLRAGQVLQRMDENDKAQGIYEYGLKNVSVGDSKVSHSAFLSSYLQQLISLKQLLRGVLEDLRAKCAPAKAMDVLMELPVELIEMILSYLSFRNIV